MKKPFALALALALMGSPSVVGAQEAMSAPPAATATASTGGTPSFTSVDAKATGTARILTAAGGRAYVELSKDFSLGDAPAPYVLLYKSAEPPHKGYVAGQYVNLGALKNRKGAQRYAIPSGVDLTGIRSIAIWCKKFDVTLAYARLGG
ncbi:DM13 domain-containing protein [Gloeobacter kilaueensis]|uniref:DM13 domain-containing protein n=1 Tax=Gloeobacter kilaueensis (strain ATCC BAA-2537 / CCAP 1431/1 / ULC 316 / JS1) TaxID=1183438 RepID=U5QR65_GLOK1|nr:DM13 domain-containing protein [Gloeobacter kilaueensis]AGY60149.1 hypothetical protein GKIL_3903 [Gloeobacter kilaueensis JS1]